MKCLYYSWHLSFTIFACIFSKNNFMQNLKVNTHVNCNKEISEHFVRLKFINLLLSGFSTVLFPGEGLLVHCSWWQFIYRYTIWKVIRKVSWSFLHKTFRWESYVYPLSDGYNSLHTQIHPALNQVILWPISSHQSRRVSFFGKPIFTARSVF